MNQISLQKYHIITYGCQMNLHESEKLAGMLEALGVIETNEQSEADIILINTCTIRKNADNRAIGNLGYIKTIKEKNPKLIVCVFGCMTQAGDSAKELSKKFPFINIIFGTHNLYKFTDYLSSALEDKRIIEIFDNSGDKAKEVIEGLPTKRVTGVNAWVNIMYGCDNYCTYCIVPFVRGKERSREPELIIDEVKKLLVMGYKEITLLGQYEKAENAIDKGEKKVNFANLLETLAVLPHKFRLRFMTSHPKDLSDEVISVIAKHDNIPEFFHLPVQSGSSRVLELMNRKYTKEHYLATIEKIKKAIPSAGFSSDVMVGFPCETEEDFLDTLDLIEKVKFHNLFMFVFSPRDGTKASEMDGQIEKNVSQDRFNRLEALQKKIALELAKENIGKTYEVLVDEYDEIKSRLRGKTASGKIIWIPLKPENEDKKLQKSDLEKHLGEFIKVKVTSTRNTNLYGEII